MPASGRSVGNREYAFGLRHLERFAGGPRGAMAEFLYPYAFRDVSFKLWDFQHDTLDLNDWTTNTGTGGTAFALPGTLGANGTIAGATGTDATAGNRVVNLYGPPIYQGDKNAGLMVRLRISAVTDIEWGLGFIDTHTTITTPVVLVGDVDDASSLAAGMGDAALIYQDTAQTLVTPALIGLGSGALNAGSTDAIGAFAPTAATDFIATVQLDGNTATATLQQAAGGQRAVASKAAAIEGGTLVRPFLVISGPTATSRTYTIDFIAAWQDRG
jgi:hypothetical protein